MSKITAVVQNIAIYRREENKLLYMVAKKDTQFIKLFYSTTNYDEILQLIKEDEPLMFEVTVNKNLTSIYKNQAVPFYDVSLFSKVPKEEFKQPNFIPLNPYETF